MVMARPMAADRAVAPHTVLVTVFMMELPTADFFSSCQPKFAGSV
jgi:hypothetical protein